MNNKLTPAGRLHLQRVKMLPCSVCDAPGPVEAHHTKQGNQWTAIAVCPDCHRGYNGLHGTKAFLRIRKMDENDALNITLQRLCG